MYKFSPLIPLSIHLNYFPVVTLVSDLPKVHASTWRLWKKKFQSDDCFHLRINDAPLKKVRDVRRNICTQIFGTEFFNIMFWSTMSVGIYNVFIFYFCYNFSIVIINLMDSRKILYYFIRRSLRVNNELNNFLW